MNDGPRHADAPIVVSLGEALFDCFADRSILGGAPLNLIVHLRQLLNVTGGQGFLLSRVGDDPLGRQVIEELQSRNIPIDLVQTDPARPTGQVRVHIAPNGEPDYEIAENVAWDYIEFTQPLQQLAATCSAVCFGTLAQRSPVSRATIHQFLSSAQGAIRVLDVNLRQNFFTPEILGSSLAAANVVKLNEEELSRIGLLLPERFGAAREADERAKALLQQFELDVLALTRGARGTVVYTKEGRFEGEAASMQAHALADDVGAGDACCAGLIYGLLTRLSMERTVALANRMGAFVASQPGGTPWLPQELLAGLG